MARRPLRAPWTWSPRHDRRGRVPRAVRPGGGDCLLVTSTSAPVVADSRPRPGDPLDPDAAISIRGLVKRYGDRTAVDRLDLDIGRGEIFAPLGPNGAGRPSTVEVLEGYRMRASGVVRVLGI